VLTEEKLEDVGPRL